jgi:hypothetical protein
MRKVFVALVVAVILGVGGYFGVVYWTQHAATREVEATLEGWAKSVGSATHGRVEFDLWSRTLKVSDIVVQSKTGPHPKVTLTQLVASGIGLSGKASRVEIVGLETSEMVPGQRGFRVEQKAPSIVLTDFSARPFTPTKVGSLFDLSRLWLEQFSSITATSIEVPSLTVTMTATEGPPGVSSEYKYTNLVVRDVRGGRFAEATMDGVALRSSLGGPHTELSGEMGKSSILDGDVGPVLAVLDPSRPRSDDYQRVYRQMKIGPYTVRMGNITTVSVDSIVAEDIGLRSSKLKLDDLLFITDVASVPNMVPSPAQASVLFDKVASLYEGLYLGKLDAQGFRIDGGAMGEKFKMSALRLDRLENGRFREIAIEGFNAKPPFGDPLDLGRMAFKELDIAKMLRLMPQLAPPGPRGQGPSPEQVTALLSLLQGIEVKDVAIPDPATRRLIKVDTFTASWGQYVDGIPTQGRVTVKVGVPLSAFGQEPLFQTLASNGVSSLTVAFDLGSVWTEASQALTVEPGTLEISNLISVSLKASLKNVTRDALSLDPMKSMPAIFLVEAGPIELSVRDLGLVDLLAAEMAREKGAAPETGRALLLESMAMKRQGLASTSPDLEKLFQAMDRFVQGKGETLTIKVTPKSRVGVMELMTASQVSPDALWNSFNIEVATGQ